MDTPFLKIGVSYMDIHSIERLKTFPANEGRSEPSVEMYFKTGKSWSYVGAHYDIDEIARQIDAFYKQLPEPTGEEVNRFELMEVSDAK